ncbi:MAG: NADH:ubiquinone reductase (Na(+)-transporting) subunit C [Bacteroidales bacterium]|jgi:Na+-transporting NADH:ubiquinone oxidoreductase subunit C|nr:NADH:ubiquinone reductase (Na(+)-transporting) subunit C [Bacteroidales bacterium]
MDINSNKYTFAYAVILVVVVAVLLSVAATLLQPKQTENVRIEKMQNILKAATTGKDIEISQDNATELYQKYIVKELAVDTLGNIISNYDVKKGAFLTKEQIRAFDLDPKQALDNIKNKKEPMFSIFVYEDEEEQRYVLPVRGTGLWGSIWGNIALDQNLDFIQGVTFDHAGETPGLGANITLPQFTSQFIGKQVVDDKNQLLNFLVIKGGIQKLPEQDRKHAVDALSGATITSNGVQYMLNDFFHYYKNWILNQQVQD